MIGDAPMKIKPPVFILILTLTLISTLYMNLVVVRPNVELRIDHEDRILAGQMDAPYQYRVLQPLISRAVQSLLVSFPSRSLQHILAYTLLDYATFAGIFLSFYIFLKRTNLTEPSTLLGLALLQVVIPLSVTGYDVNGDFITLFFYILGLNLAFSGREDYLPLVIGVATFNREQIIFLLAFYLAYRLGHPKGIDKRALCVVVLSLVAFIAAYLAVRLIFGFKVNPSTLQLVVANNTDPQRLLYIVLLWSAQVAGFVALSALAFKQSVRFFKLAFLSLGVYGALFFVNGNMWEMAKFLPAFLIMIPMGLQALTGQYVESSALYPPGTET
jgi:hypothetical protein